MKFAKLVNVATGLASLVCIAAQAQAQRLRTAKHDSLAVVTLEHEWLNAEHDSATLNHVLAADFRHSLPTGQIITKARHIEWVVSHPAPVGQTSRFGRLDVSLFGDAAVADGSVVTKDGSGHEVRQTAFSDVFVYRSGNWQAVHAQETEVARSSHLNLTGRP